jgi:hypothetical protein
MNEEQRIKVLEEELKVLKNELKTVMLDLREQYLNIQNPFNYSTAANTGSPQPEISPERETNANGVKKDETEEIDNEDYSSNMDTDEPLIGMEMPDLSGAPTLGPSSLDDQFASAGLQFAELETSAMSDPCSENTMQEIKTVRSKRIEDDDSDDSDDSDLNEEPETNIVAIKSTSPKNNKKKPLNLPTGNPKFDLVVIAGLTQWIDQATAKLGRERTEALVEMSCTMGRTPENLKEVLIKMARLSPHESNGQPLKASDYLSILAQLENLLGDSEIKDHALLSILSMMKESNDG